MRLVLFLLFAAPVLAQYSRLATTDDGGQLFFSSTLQLAGSTDTSSSPKIYRYDGTSIQLYAEVAKIATGPPPTNLPGGYSIDSNYYSLQAPFVSGDGSVAGFVGYADCTGCTYTRVLAAQTTFQSEGALGSLTLPYECDISTNGQYALCQIRYVLPGTVPAVLVDLSSRQQRTEIGASCWGDAHYVTASGSVIAVQGQQLALWSAALGLRPLSIAYAGYSQSCPMISNDGSLIVHATNAALLIYNVTTGTDTVLLTVTQVSRPRFVTISNDARWILVEVYDGSALQLAVVDSSDGSMKQLTSETRGIQHGASTLSGDGSTVYVATASGALLKIDARSGVSQQIVASQPVVTSLFGALVPGSLNQIFGAGLGSAQVTLNGAALPIVSSTPTEIDVQIPWETPAGAAVLQVAPATQTPFQQSLPLQIQAYQPVAALSSAIAGDFSGLNSPFSPANPGDVVTFYLTGLGVVTVPVADGSPAPARPLPWLRDPMTVTFGSTPVQVLYAGLAPGLVGIYQLSVQAPLQVPGNPFLPNRGPVSVGMTMGSFALPGVWMNPNQ